MTSCQIFYNKPRRLRWCYPLTVSVAMSGQMHGSMISAQQYMSHGCYCAVSRGSDYVQRTISLSMSASTQQKPRRSRITLPATAFTTQERALYLPVCVSHCTQERLQQVRPAHLLYAMASTIMKAREPTLLEFECDRAGCSLDGGTVCARGSFFSVSCLCLGLTVIPHASIAAGRITCILFSVWLCSN